MSELYQLPDGWEWKKLDDITKLITKGTTPTTNGYKFQNSGINFLKIENIVNGEIDLSTIEMFISEEAHQSQKRSQLQENDVLFSIAGTIGDTAIVKKEHLPMNTNQAIALIRPKEILNSFFLKYSLVSIISQNTKDKQRGGAIKNISLGDIKDLMYPLPPLEEQKRIVSKLNLLFEKIDKSIALHQKNMDEADVFMGSVLNDVFGELEEKYETKQLKEFTNITSSKRIHKADYIENGVPFYRSKEIILKSKNIELTDILYISENTFSEFEKKFGVPKEDDILITAVGTIGVTYLVNKDDRFYFKDGNLIWLRDISVELNKKYLLYTFKSPQFQNYVDEISKGAAQKALTIIKLNELTIPIPSVSIQQKVVKYLDEISEKIEKIKSVQKEKMDSLKALKASILDGAFRGEL